MMLIFLAVAASGQDGKAVIKGIVKDAATGETMPGATIIIKGTSIGVMADMDGRYSISVNPGIYRIECSYVAYNASAREINISVGEEMVVDFDISEATVGIGDVVIVAKANRETENLLLMERKEAAFSIESMGARELSRKGASDVKDGVTKMAGITAMGSQQLFVRGLGDRYNNATLNAMPIPSGNPTRKVIDLDIIPSKIVQKIDVNKAFSAANYADFCGATIDITTKELVSDNFLNIDIGTSYNTLSYNNQMKFEDGFRGLKSYFGFNNERYKLPSEIGPIGDASNDLSSILYDPFYTDFSYSSGRMLPALNIGLSGGRKVVLGNNDLNILFAGGFRNGFDFSYGSKRLFETGGGTIYDFDFQKWTYKANTTALLNLNYQLNANNEITLSSLMVNNTNNSIEENFGYHSTNDGLIKARRYEYDNNRVLNSMISGIHRDIGSSGRYELNWKFSVSHTSADSPDRRDLTWNFDEANEVYYLRRESIANYRTFINMYENEGSGRIDFRVKLGEQANDFRRGSILFGLQAKVKNRDFGARDFFYGTRYLTGTHDPENPNQYLSDEAIQNGELTIQEATALSSYYLVYQYIYSGYLEVNYNLTPEFLVNLGIRGEYDDQSIYYRKSPERTTFDDPWIILNKVSPGLYPALNIRYSTGAQSNLRLSASRTVSRPLFIELGPFVNRGMYGEHSTFGNPELTNSLNYNLDVKYEIFPAAGDLLSLSLYGKYIDNPIEKFYKASSSKLVSWINSKSARVAGFEIEFRKQFSNIGTESNIFSPLQVGLNFAYLYSQIDLGESAGINTNRLRPLQGASPYIINADIGYQVDMNRVKINLSAVYNVFGSRIYAVGTDGKDDIYENPVHTLDAIISASIGGKMGLNLSFKNILNPAVLQTVNINGEEMVMNEYHKGVSIGAGVSYKF